LADRGSLCVYLVLVVRRRSKVFQSILGELKLDRAYYHCPHCRSGFYPRDRQLGIEKTCFSPATVRLIGTVGSMVSFQEGSQLLRELAGIGIDASQVERGAEALGEEIATDERFHNGPLGEEPLPPTLYLGLDGTGIPMRAEELAGSEDLRGLERRSARPRRTADA
jgi:hypothetical protein